MAKIKTIFVITVVFYCSLLSQEFLDAPFTNRISFGLNTKLGLNFHIADFKGIDFPNIPSCCPRFETGFGLNYSFGGIFNYPLGEQIGLQVRTGYENLSATLKKKEKEYFSTTEQAGVWGEFEHSVKSKINSATTILLITYRLNQQINLHFGPSLYFLIKKDYEQKEEIINPSFGVFAIERTRVRNFSNGTIPNSNSIILGGSVLISYLLPINKYSTVFLVPEASANFGFSKIMKTDSWQPFSLTLGASIIYAPRKTKVIKPPAPPPINPPLPEMPKPPLSPTLEASITAVSVDQSGRESPVTVLKIEEYLSTKMHPLLGYIFFDDNSYEIPQRYIKLSPNETRNFNIKKLYGFGTLEIYYNILNIIGKRVSQFPQSELIIIGCNSNQGFEENNILLSRSRAETVKNYFVNVWGISPERIKVEARNLPENPSNPNDPDGIAENRRVEIVANIPQIFEPLIVEDTLREVNPPTFRFKPIVRTSIGIDRWELITSQSQGIVKIFTGTGEIPSEIQWEVAYEQKNIPKLDEPLNYKLVVVDKDNKVWESQIQQLPVEITTVEKKIIEQVADKQIDRFSLILFGFGQSEIVGDNLKIAEIAKQRIKSTSTVKIEGFTDRIGNEQANLELSQKRANATAKVLNVDPKFARGLGETRLLYNNDLPEGRFYCRTVNIEIVTPIE
ncbi:MAG: OmpA family protein [Candidatus Kapaibacteriales bacterium]